MSKKLILIFLLALAVRAIFYVAFAVHEHTAEVVISGGDTSAYLQLAQNLLAGRGFSESAEAPFMPVAGRMPLVPALLALFGSRYLYYLILQMLIGAASVVVLYKIGQLFFSETIAVWAAIAYTLDPLPAFHSMMILTETWFAFFVLLAVWQLARLWQQEKISHAAWCGVWTGLAALTRPTGIALVPVLLFATLFLIRLPWPKRLLASLAFVLLAGIVISPWVVRNHQVFGVWGYSSLPAYNLYFYNARTFYAQIHQLDPNEAKNVFRAWADEAVRQPQFDNELKLQSFYSRKAWQVISADPVGYARYHLLNTAAVFLNTGAGDIARAWEGSADTFSFTAAVLRGPGGLVQAWQTDPLVFSGKIILALLYLLLVIGFFVNLGLPGWRGKYFFLLLLIALFGLSTGAVAEPRFRLPAEPFILLAWVEIFSIMLSGQPAAQPRPEPYFRV